MVFAGTMEEVTRVGVMSWLESDKYEDEAQKNMQAWGATFWSMWKGIAEITSAEALNRAPNAVKILDCWKPQKEEAGGQSPAL